MMEIKKGNGRIPAPGKGQRNRYPWPDMQVTDYLQFANKEEACKAYLSASRWAKSGGRRRSFVRRGSRVYRAS